MVIKYVKNTKIELLIIFLITLLIGSVIILAFSLKNQISFSGFVTNLKAFSIFLIGFVLLFTFLGWLELKRNNKYWNQLFDERFQAIIKKMNLKLSNRGAEGIIQNKEVYITFNKLYRGRGKTARILISVSFGRGGEVLRLQRRIKRNHGHSYNDYQIGYCGVIRELKLNKIKDWNTIDWENEIIKLIGFSDLVEKEKIKN